MVVVVDLDLVFTNPHLFLTNYQSSARERSERVARKHAKLSNTRAPSPGLPRSNPDTMNHTFAQPRLAKIKPTLCWGLVVGRGGVAWWRGGGAVVGRGDSALASGVVVVLVVVVVVVVMVVVAVVVEISPW